MADKNNIPKPVSDHALEMIMRDVLDGVLELSLESAFRDPSSEFEIIEIASATRSKGRDNPGSLAYDAEIIFFPGLKQAAG
ncbi:MAG: integration host factor subunit beta [Sedimenticola sp.]|jgi:hypothetical protein|nr:MAG: integration host factor subunit beta [Sedimenticola sp.]